MHPDDREFVKEFVRKALCEKHPYRIDHRIVLPDGTERVVHEQAEVIFDNSDKAIQMNGTVQDVTERKRAEEELRKLSTVLEFLKSKLIETRVNPKQLIFEITETAAIHDIDKAIKFVETLKSIGCGFSLDDFGVGFTSFQYLKEIRVDFIKIDGSFIRKLYASKVDCLFVKAIVDVAKGMEIKTTAEFVENEETIRILKEYGVDYAQGYFIGKPSPDI